MIWPNSLSKTKLRGDQRRAKADVAVIVSQALPENVTTFALIEGVYVVSPHCAVPVAAVLRESLIEVGRIIAGEDTVAPSGGVGLEKERRLLYVALSRASRELWLVSDLEAPSCYLSLLEPKDWDRSLEST